MLKTQNIIVFLLLLVIFPGALWSQESTPPRRWELKGYLNDLQMVQFQKVNDPWILDNEIHNRLDFSWYPGTLFRLGIGMRNRFLFGQSFTQNPAYKGSLTTDPGLVNMTWSLLSGNSFLLVSQFDRAWFSVTTGKVQLTVGRQRINWGQSIVWNPNDIFNTYSFYDFDYPERPGSDAIRLQFYPSSTATIEAAVKWNKQGRITIAGLGRFNLWQYDIQFIGGLVDDQDWVIGTGWSGNISQAGFRGEVSYFYPKSLARDTSGILLATMGLDYSFSNSLYLIFQVFYNQLPPNFQPETLLSIYQAPPSPKTLSFSEWNIFLQGSYPITPLFDVSLAAMYYPNLNGYFIGPNVNYSIRQNIDLSFFLQYFNGRFKDTGPQQDQNIYFQACISALRLKWSF